jgi:hypothetical protein
MALWRLVVCLPKGVRDQTRRSRGQEAGPASIDSFDGRGMVVKERYPVEPDIGWEFLNGNGGGGRSKSHLRLLHGNAQEGTHMPEEAFLSFQKQRSEIPTLARRCMYGQRCAISHM